jgi:hypothetical protein
MRQLSLILWLTSNQADPILLGCAPHVHAEPNTKGTYCWQNSYMYLQYHVLWN